ncbi:hypothetical protein RY831_26840 [Noviherbaspirillum sp. CPCC 100848]|uniref:Transmembrane protein n=1 Tax=Noviherbaspirillum album TaxID=3080276 RepID=A0ABU6JGJ5_9BURK|nr:hypothetical protein [Noviherbaspirillum sp. CPCC 100848]MEC4722782.1 hypothetical protein [Noviherbaspirillum sp. CPCC 100848]
MSKKNKYNPQLLGVRQAKARTKRRLITNSLVMIASTLFVFLAFPFAASRTVRWLAFDPNCYYGHMCVNPATTWEKLAVVCIWVVAVASFAMMLAIYGGGRSKRDVHKNWPWH